MLGALALLASPIVITASVPSTVAPGEKVVLSATVRNVSRRPITLVKVEVPNMRFGMSFHSSLTGPHGEVVFTERNGPMDGQWTVGPEVRKDAFMVLKPGESRPLYREVFTRYFTEGRVPGIIAEYVRAPKANLLPGVYRVFVQYALERKLDGPTALSGRNLVFETGSRALFDGSWKGEATAEASFEVKAR